MGTISTILFFAFCIGAAFIQRVSGFGFGIFIMTMLPFLMPSYGEATTLSGLLASVTSTLIISRMWRHIKWRTLLPILITFLIVSYFAVEFVAYAHEQFLKKILGAMLIIASIYFFFFSKKIHLRPTLPVQISMGTLSGLMGGLFGMQGPPAVLYFLTSSKTKEEYIALAQSYFLIGNICMTVFRARNGFLTYHVISFWAIGLGAVLIGTWIGSKTFERLSAERLRKIVYSYMAISGLLAMIS